jgi:large subunit ribosomal protein L5
MKPLKEKYRKEAVPAMQGLFHYKSPMAVPAIVKVTLNTGIGRIVAGKSLEEQKKIAQDVAEDLSLIAAQKAVPTLAKRSIASFKSRQGMPIGVKVTLRGQRMYDFLDRLIHIVLPRSRDFQGLDGKSLDKKGNMSIGIKEHIFFSEISPEKVKHMVGLEITVTLNSKTKEEGLALLKNLGFPIQ